VEGELGVVGRWCEVEDEGNGDGSAWADRGGWEGDAILAWWKVCCGGGGGGLGLEGAEKGVRVLVLLL